MSPFLAPPLSYKEGRLHLGGVAVDELATRFGTPLYAYDFDAVLRKASSFQSLLSPSLRPLVCFAVKANSSVALLKLLGQHGVGADVVSVGELLTARKAGISGDKIVFSGVGKTLDEISLAIDHDIHSFNVESESEIKRLEKVASLKKKKICIALRVNPDIDAKTHPKIATGLFDTKFGLDETSVIRIANEVMASQWLCLEGLSIHIGSQIESLEPLRDAFFMLLTLGKKLRSSGVPLKFLDLGGGLGIPYESGRRQASLDSYLSLVNEIFIDQGFDVVLEPGRVLIAEEGILIAKVIDIKKTKSKNFLILDAGMNDLVRPAMYDAHHEILPAWLQKSATSPMLFDVVGPVCETSDLFAKDRLLSHASEGSLVVLSHAGAYGYSMASTYNQRPLPAEVAVLNGSVKLIRRRPSMDDLWRYDLS